MAIKRFTLVTWEAYLFPRIAMPVSCVIALEKKTCALFQVLTVTVRPSKRGTVRKWKQVHSKAASKITFVVIMMRKRQRLMRSILASMYTRGAVLVTVEKYTRALPQTLLRVCITRVFCIWKAPCSSMTPKKRCF